jgi:PDZ domain-containing protein
VTRRTATLWLGAGLAAGLVVLSTLLPVPYVVFSPGPTADVLATDDDGPVITVEGAPSFPTDGRLDLTTVTVTPADARLDLMAALVAWLDPARAVLPRDAVYPEDATSEEVREVNTALFTGSQDRAVGAALSYLGFEPTGVEVVVLVEDAPAAGVLEPGDVVTAIDGEPVTSAEDVQAAVSGQRPGSRIPMTVERDGETLELRVPSAPAPDDETRAVVGVQIRSLYPVEVGIDVGQDIGGSSAGLVFALGVVDTMTEGPLLGGRHVAGTGEISPDGVVGPIGGVQQKIVAARGEGATLFLAPADNCPAAVGAPAGDMQVVPVATLDEAVAVLEAVDAGDAADLPSCADVVAANEG